MKRIVSRTVAGTVAACRSSKGARARVAAALLICGLCAQDATAQQELAVPDTPVTRRWMPRHFTLGVGGVATSAPGRGTTYSPTFGGAFDASAIGYLSRSLAWRAEGFLHLHDRSVASETGILSNADGDTCAGEACTEPRETSRRTTGLGIGIEHHPMRGRVGVYTVAMLGVAGTNSYGDAGRCLGFAPSVGVGLLAPLSNGLDGFALEARWRRVPTVLGAVNAGVLSLSLRF